MGYEDLLDKAMEGVERGESCPSICTRFEVKKVEGHHLGSKTVISNFGAIVSCVGRKKEHLAKFLFKSLATSGIIDGERLILDRKISSKEINNRIDRYVKEFVCCSKCNKPDTEIIQENGKKFLRCMACGAKRQVHGV